MNIELKLAQIMKSYLESEVCTLETLSDGNCLDIISDIWGCDSHDDFDKVDLTKDFLGIMKGRK